MHQGFDPDGAAGGGGGGRGMAIGGGGGFPIEICSTVAHLNTCPPLPKEKYTNNTSKNNNN